MAQAHDDRPDERTPFDDDLHDPAYDTDQGYDHELDLQDDDDARLPWLEGDDEDYDDGGSGQLIGFVLGGVLLLALIVGGLWWLTRGTDDGDLVADGSTIEAPDQPYKERPEDPGGRELEGTGDTSYAVSEGQERPAQLGTPGASDDSAEPGVAPVEAEPESSEALPGASPADTGGVGVQVGAYTSREKAEAGWSSLAGRLSQLSGLRHRIVEGQADIGKVFRLQAVASDAAAARTLCRELQAAGQNCYVKN